jgi:DNA-binding GntR family transcriptional regulator
LDNLEAYLANQPAELIDSDSRLRRDIAYDRLKDAIQHANLEPGELLSETRLSRLLGISRTPVREALHQLAQEGMVQVIPGRAVTVASPSAQTVLDVVHMRLLLEPESVRLVTEVIPEGNLDLLKKIVQRMEDACAKGDRIAWSKADTDFHEIITEACPNRLLGDTVAQMRNRTHHLANIDSQTNPSRLAECTQEHQEIVNKLSTRDADGAEFATRQHIEKLRESLFTRLSYG